MLRGRSSFVVTVSCDVVKHNPCPTCKGISSQQYLLSMHRQHILLLCCQCCLQCFSENKRAFVPGVPHCAVTTRVLRGLFGIAPHTGLRRKVPPQLPGKTQSAWKKALQVTFGTSCCRDVLPRSSAALGIPAAAPGKPRACTGGWGAFEWNLAFVHEAH